MHSKRLGNVGEVKVAAYLVGLGYSVFRELGDISKIDLVLEYKGTLISIQVKAISKVNGMYPFAAKKSGPNYQFKYTEKDCNLFALYCVEDDCIIWLKSSEVTGPEKSFNFRVDACKQNQSKKVRWLRDFLSVTRVLRDYEQNNQIGNAMVDDIVQTTTLKIEASEN